MYFLYLKITKIPLVKTFFHILNLKIQGDNLYPRFSINAEIRYLRILTYEIVNIMDKFKRNLVVLDNVKLF